MMMRLVTIGCILGTLISVIAGCSTAVVEVRDSYLPLEPGRPYKMSYRRTGEVCGSRDPGASWIADAITVMTQNSDRIDNILGLHVETKNSPFSQCVAVSGYPIIYVDNQQKRGVFSRRMMYGPSGGGAAAPSTPMRESPPVVSDAPAPAPAPAAAPAAAPVAATAPKPKSAAPTKAVCEAKCARFAGIWKGSAAIQGTIRRNCVQKCVKPDKKAYRSCIDAAASIEDIGKCNNM